MKRCACCRETKPLDAFSCASSSADGRQSWCKGCKAADAKRRYHEAPEPQRESSRQRMRARRAAAPEGEKAYIDDWRARNADRVRARDAARRQSPTRRAWQAAYWRQWKLDNPEATRLIARRGAAARRARLADAFVEQVDSLVVLDQHEGTCGICGEPVDPDDFHVDHVQALSRGGEHSYANAQPAHPRCNIAKGNRERQTIEVVKDGNRSRIAA